MDSTPTMQPALNHVEWNALVCMLGPEVEGLQVDRVFVPHRKFAPDGYFKHEWALRLSRGQAKTHLIFSVRPQCPYLYITSHALTPAPQATHSGFDLAMGKLITGLTLKSLRTIPGERFVRMDFERGHDRSSGHTMPKWGVLLNLIPQTTEAFLVPLEGVGETSRTYDVISRSKVEKLQDREAHFELPPARPPSKAFQVRDGFPGTAAELQKHLEEFLSGQSFDLRRAKIQRDIRQRQDQLSARRAECEDSLRRAEREPDYDRAGSLLKGSLHLPETQVVHPGPAGSFYREVKDFAADAWVKVPVFAEGKMPEANLIRDVEKLFQLGKRKKRKQLESQERAAHFEKELKLIADFASRAAQVTPAELNALERDWRERSATAAGVSAREEKQSGLKKTGWRGKVFRSREGMLILVGRNKTENQELSFKMARGNDVWLHVKAKPGAHVVISVPPKKSASLETLLDAALLCLYYSGGAEWGKTEVDYTFCKYIKRIKDSSEASYTQQKTLVIQFEPERWERLQKSEVVL